MTKYGGVSAELAAVDGRKRLNMDRTSSSVYRRARKRREPPGTGIKLQRQVMIWILRS